MLPSSVPTKNKCSDMREKSKQHPPAKPMSAESSSSSLASFARSLRCIRSEYSSSDFASVHSVTRPSEEMEKKFKFLARSSSCQHTSQTGSVCLPVLTVDW